MRPPSLPHQTEALNQSQGGMYIWLVLGIGMGGTQELFCS